MKDKNKIEKWIQLLESYGTDKNRWPKKHHSVWKSINEYRQNSSASSKLQRIWFEAQEVDDFFTQEIPCSDENHIHYQGLIDKIVDSNFHLDQSSWVVQIKNLFSELFPVQERRFSLLVMLSTVVFSGFLAWNLLTTTAPLPEVIENLVVDTSQAEAQEVVSGLFTSGIWDLEITQ